MKNQFERTRARVSTLALPGPASFTTRQGVRASTQAAAVHQTTRTKPVVAEGFNDSGLDVLQAAEA